MAQAFNAHCSKLGSGPDKYTQPAEVSPRKIDTTSLASTLVDDYNTLCAWLSSNLLVDADGFDCLNQAIGDKRYDLLQAASSFDLSRFQIGDCGIIFKRRGSRSIRRAVASSARFNSSLRSRSMPPSVVDGDSKGDERSSSGYTPGSST